MILQRLADWIVIILGVGGVIINCYTAYDIHLDRKAADLLHETSISRLVASIGIRASICGAITHGLFLFLGALALISPTNQPTDTITFGVSVLSISISRIVFNLIISAIFIVIQAVIVIGQILNQIDRTRVRMGETS
jgi:hypothetical protein